MSFSSQATARIFLDLFSKAEAEVWENIFAASGPPHYRLHVDRMPPPSLLGFNPLTSATHRQPHTTAGSSGGREGHTMSQGLTYIIGSVAGCLQGILGGLFGKAKVSELEHGVFLLGRVEQVFRLDEKKKTLVWS